MWWERASNCTWCTGTMKGSIALRCLCRDLCHLAICSGTSAVSWWRSHERV